MTTMPSAGLAAPVSGADLIARIGAGALDRETACARFAGAYEEKEPALKCFVTADYAGAFASAAEGPLHGLPVGIKDIIDTSDFPTRHGSPIYAENRPLADAPLVALARRAGAAIVGKTVTTEFAYFTARGTKNPWNPLYSPGGSSSGSAAAVAAGMAPFAVGTQTGGSVIRPAAFCGIAGFKPSFGLIPAIGVKPFSVSLDTVGVFGAGVADCILLASVLSERSLEAAPERTPVFGLCRTPQWLDASPAMRAAVERAAAKAQDAGAKIIEIELPAQVTRAFEAHPLVQNYEAARALMWERSNHHERISPILAELLEQGAEISTDEYDAAHRTAKSARMALAGVFRQADALLTPSAEDIAPADPANTGKPTFNKLWTLLGAPCVNVPGLRAENGLPLGVQVVGPGRRDAQTLAAAAWLENALLG